MSTRLFVIVLGASLIGGAARAQAPSAEAQTTEPPAAPANVCSDSYQQAQITRREGKSALLQARAAARTCLSSSCQGWMTADCSQWLGELDARIPTVVFSAKNSADRDLVEVAVRVDGRELATQLDGRAIEFEPGSHTFVFVAKDGAQLEKQVVVREGGKAQVVSVVFEASAEELAAQRRAQHVEVLPPVHREPAPNTLRYVGWGGLALGALGLGLGAGFGISAAVRKGNLGCDDAGRCTASQDRIDGGATASDISTAAFIAGGVLAAGGLVLVLWPRSSRTIAAQPVAGPNLAGLQLGGRF